MRNPDKAASTTLFPSKMSVPAPRGLQAAIEVAARQRHTGAAEWARKTLFGALADAGVHVLPSGRVVVDIQEGGSA
jgi:hypothetical protein